MKLHPNHWLLVSILLLLKDVDTWYTLVTKSLKHGSHHFHLKPKLQSKLLFEADPVMLEALLCDRFTQNTLQKIPPIL